VTPRATVALLRDQPWYLHAPFWRCLKKWTEKDMKRLQNWVWIRICATDKELFDAKVCDRGRREILRCTMRFEQQCVEILAFKVAYEISESEV